MVIAVPTLLHNALQIKGGQDFPATEAPRESFVYEAQWQVVDADSAPAGTGLMTPQRTMRAAFALEVSRADGGRTLLAPSLFAADQARALDKIAPQNATRFKLLGRSAGFCGAASRPGFMEAPPACLVPRLASHALQALQHFISGDSGGSAVIEQVALETSAALPGSGHQLTRCVSGDILRGGIS